MELLYTLCRASFDDSGRAMYAALCRKILIGSEPGSNLFSSDQSLIITFFLQDFNREGKKFREVSIG